MSLNGILHKMVIGVLTVTLLTAGASAREKLYVFYPSILYPQSMQERMEHTLKGITIIVFGKYDDFSAHLQSDSPDALIAKPVLVDKLLDKYVKSLNGERNGSTKERYVIISTDKQFDVASINKATVIGAMDILGRTGMSMFLQQFFPVGPKLKRVSRVGDLLPVLSLHAATGVIIEDVFVEYLKSTSKMNFSVTPLVSTDYGIVVCAVKKDGKAQKIITGLKKNDKTITDLFYIDQWK